MKLAVIGGGSTYTPELADGIGRLLPEHSAACHVARADAETRAFR